MKKFILLFLISLPLILIGCGISNISNPFSSGQNSHANVNVYVGTQGMSAEFSKTAPPPTVLQDSNFPILIKLKNSGAYGITEKKGLMSIGIEKDYAKIISLDGNPSLGEFNLNKIPFEIAGKSPSNPKGDEIYISLNAKTGKLDPQSETHTSTITATLCYPYQTMASATVCIDPDPSGIRPGKKVCTAKDMTFGSGQGAPIAVTRIESQMVPGDNNNIYPQFLIYVENRGGGDSVNPSNYRSACTQSDGVKTDVWNLAYINVYTSTGNGETQLSCCPNSQNNCGKDAGDKTGKLKFKDKKDFVRCTFRDSIPKNYDAYTSPLKIVIDYGYVQSVAANFDIKKPLKY